MVKPHKDEPSLNLILQGALKSESPKRGLRGCSWEAGGV